MSEEKNSSELQLRSLKPWGRRVTEYLDRLEETTERIQGILEQCKVNTTGLEQAKVEEQMKQLENSLGDLEARLAEREQLLKAPDSAGSGLTLTDRLSGENNPLYRESATRCQVLSGRLQEAHERAIALFVCQHQLADFSTGTLRLLAGAELQQTYGMQGGRIRKGTDHRCSGSIFDNEG